MKIAKNILFGLLICLVITACEYQFVRYPTHPHLNIDWHHFDKTHLLKRMRCDGIYVTQVGDRVSIIIPSDNLFYFDTAKLVPNYEPALDNVVCFIKHYGPVCRIEVAAYTDNVRDFCINKKLSIEQAKAVVGYLWGHDIPFNVFYPVGFGSSCPVANNYTSRGSYYNRRVEIKFMAPP